MITIVLMMQLLPEFIDFNFFKQIMNDFLEESEKKKNFFSQFLK